MAVVLDTSFLIDVASRHLPARERLALLTEADEAALIPSIVVAEYVAGARRPKHAFRQLERAGEILSLTADDALAGAAIASQTFRSGRFPGWMDALVAGFAANRGQLMVVTRNARHFPLTKTLSY